jgi:hypothetical protein
VIAILGLGEDEEPRDSFDPPHDVSKMGAINTPRINFTEHLFDAVLLQNLSHFAQNLKPARTAAASS